MLCVLLGLATLVVISWGHELLSPLELAMGYFSGFLSLAMGITGFKNT